ncbi:uncharacterized protein LTR77_002515 [Saxophila tyrrhenica]|uniref:Uncharacterized protein n=1 Tax=Saxophila tyrrhenica TaxID=1690608 RepID=A0AAV9PIV8_9PEZI|nr:hypothetical protein LTR77_002515 [Saxophila tyrrhenica]
MESETKVQFPLKDAEELANSALRKLGYDSQQAERISHHLIDSELRGFGIAGLARILSIADRLAGKKPATATKITREAPATAQLDGQDTLGYLVGYEATELAIKKCKEVGVSVVGANGTYYTGMLSYYAEMAARENLVTVIASHCTAWVAPEGTYKPLVGTNPFAIGIPTSSAHPPIIYDIGTSKIIHAQCMLARRLGTEIPPDTAYNAEGEMTTDPHQALSGALKVWGGAKGSGLALSVQLLGIVAGAPALPPNLENFGFFIMMVNPAMFQPLEEFTSEVDKIIDAWHAAPSTSGSPMRVPFERSNKMREEQRATGYVNVESGVIEKLRALVGS